MSEEIKLNDETVIKIDENYEDIFITENNKFTISLEYYNNGEDIIVEGNDDFDKTRTAKKINVTFKKPSQGDITAISNSSIRNSVKNIETLSINDFLLLEIARFLCLIRSWSIPKKISQDTIMSINPKIIKGILAKVREIIGTEGII
jgi:hypothetical protein